MCPAEGVSLLENVFMKGGDAAAHPPVGGMLEDGPDVSHLRVTDVTLPGGTETIDGPKLTPVGSRDSETSRTKVSRSRKTRSV